MNYLDALTEVENIRQRDTLNLIASENYPSPKILKLMGSVWTTKYAEGYPGKRYYAGNTNTDTLESSVQEDALEAFAPNGGYGVNVQVLSGSSANSVVYLSVLKPGDTIMSLNLSQGGHLSHLHSTSSWNSIYKHVTYGVHHTDIGFEIDFDDYKRQIQHHKPQLVIIGFSAYPSSYKFGQLIRTAHEHGCIVLADIAHINGLVAAGLHDSPFRDDVDGADFVTMTTHKTLRGPRGALVFAKTEFLNQLNTTVFPGTSGGPHLHQIAAIGQALLEVLGKDAYPDNLDFKTYSANIIENMQAFEAGIISRGLFPVTKTATHLSLIELPVHLDSLEVQRKLESLGIISNRNQIPFDDRSAWRPSGMRFGMAALTSRGITKHASQFLGSLVGDAVLGAQEDTNIKAQVRDVLAPLHWYYKS